MDHASVRATLDTCLLSEEEYAAGPEAWKNVANPFKWDEAIEIALTDEGEGQSSSNHGNETCGHDHHKEHSHSHAHHADSTPLRTLAEAS